MPIPKQFIGKLDIPAVAAPMFLASGMDLVIEACKAGVLGAFPALNARTSEEFDAWLYKIETALAEHEQKTGKAPAPYGVNIIVNRTNDRVQTDLGICVQHKVPLIITSLGAAGELVDTVHAYGGIVFHDVIKMRHAKKAAGAGVDGLIAVCAGAGGHAGTMSPLSLIPEIRDFFDGTILLSGCISNGAQILAAQALGADLAYLGTRFIATDESGVQEDYKKMIVDVDGGDIVYTNAVSGVHGSFMGSSIRAAGLDPDNLPSREERKLKDELTPREKRSNAWSNIWSAGQGVGSIKDILPTAELCARLKREYAEAVALQKQKAEVFVKS